MDKVNMLFLTNKKHKLSRLLKLFYSLIGNFLVAKIFNSLKFIK